MSYRLQNYTILLLFLTAFGLVIQPSGFASAQTVEQSDTFTFKQMGLSELSLRSPYDTTYVGFSLPAIWQPNADATVQLKLQVLMTEATTPATQPVAPLTGILRIKLNDQTVATFLIDSPGQQTLSIPLPLADMLAFPTDRRHVLAIQLETNERCETNQFARILIDPGSSLTIPHQIIKPPIDLSKLPFPIVQNALQKEKAVEKALIVIADQPSDNELQAALIVAAGLGRMTAGQLDIKLLSVSQLNDTDMRSNHLVFVGVAASWSSFEKLSLPAPWVAGRFTAPAMAADDGLIQMVTSAWDDSHIMLIVSGNTDEGLEKAAQALSTGNIQVSDSKDLALVAAVDSTVPPSSLAIDETLQSLGYASQRLVGTGALYAGYEFEVPVGRSVGEDAYLELSFAHSALLDYNQSGIMISLNDESVASIRLNDTTTQLSKVRVALPAEAIQHGLNSMVIRADLLPTTPCLDPRANGLWVNLRSDSVLHLPVRTLDTENAAEPIDLKRFPHPFNVATNLSDVVVVVEPDSVSSWNSAAQLAYNIGQSMHGSLVQLQVTSTGIAEDIRSSHDVIIVGQPQALPIVAELGAALPMPFAPNSNTPSSVNEPVTYRSAGESGIGYIQLLTSPWSSQRSLLAVLGSNPAGVELATEVLIDEKLRSELAGNLAVVRPGSANTEQVNVTSSTRPGVATPIPAGTPTPEPPRVESRDTRTEPTPSPTPGPDAAISNTPSMASQLLMLAGAVLVLLVIAWVSYVILRRRKRRGVQTSDE